jgi:hypothetical protein
VIDDPHKKDPCKVAGVCVEAELDRTRYRWYNALLIKLEATFSAGGSPVHDGGEAMLHLFHMGWGLYCPFRMVWHAMQRVDDPGELADGRHRVYMKALCCNYVLTRKNKKNMIIGKLLTT